VKVLAVELYKYKEWTESLGYDREWIIQGIQHEVAMRANKVSAELGAFLLPLRYDFFALLVDGLRESELRFIFKEIGRVAPVPIRGCLGYGESFAEAQRHASLCLSDLLPGEMKDGNYKDEEVVSAHFDVDGFTSLTRVTSFYDAFLNVNRLYSSLSEKVYELGGISQYLGGDNIIAFFGRKNVKDVIDLVHYIDNVKVGIGVGRNARFSMMNATEALERIRLSRNAKWEMVPRYIT
jgi:GTP cyclohydrolase IIa